MLALVDTDGAIATYERAFGGCGVRTVIRAHGEKFAVACARFTPHATSGFCVKLPTLAEAQALVDWWVRRNGGAL